MKIQYDLTEQEEAAAKAFIKDQENKMIEKQRQSMAPEDFARLTGNGKWPYYGAIGGGFSWIITSTSIGQALRIKDNVTGEEKDITDYSNW